VGAHVQEVTVPSGITWARLVVIGGRGETRTTSPRYVKGGNGAEISGALPVNAGQHLSLYVAGRGGKGANFGVTSGAGGGGASSVQSGSNIYILAAGGGGGGGGGAGTWAYSQILRDPKATPATTGDGNGRITITWTTSP
jgi:hypothetical protein